MMADDELWRHLGSSKPQTQEQILRADRSLASQEAELKARRRRRGVFIGGIATSAVALLALAFVVNPFSGDTDVHHSTAKVTKEAHQAAAVTQWYDKKENLYPVTLPDFENTDTSGQGVKADALPDSLGDYVNTIWGGTYGETLTKATLPSEADGWTSDPTQATEKDGTLNPLFSYWTSDLFLKQSTVQATRLLNPVYGGWGRYQFADAQAAKTFDPLILDGVFSKSFVKRIQKAQDKSFVPLYADWKQNDYNLGAQLLGQDKTSYRWVGTITGKPDVKWAYDPATLNYKATVTYPVTETAWTQSQTRIDRIGTLTLTFVADQAGGHDASAFRVVVDDGSLTIK